MPSVQALLRRVHRLETARTATPSPIVQLYGSVDGFADQHLAAAPRLGAALRALEKD